MIEKLTVTFPRGGRRKVKHGAYSYITKGGKVSEHRTYILKYLTAARQGLISDLGGEEHMSTAQLILADRYVHPNKETKRMAADTLAKVFGVPQIGHKMEDKQGEIAAVLKRDLIGKP